MKQLLGFAAVLLLAVAPAAAAPPGLTAPTGGDPAEGNHDYEEPAAPPAAPDRGYDDVAPADDLGPSDMGRGFDDQRRGFVPDRRAQRQRLRARFDANGDGVLSPVERQQARMARQALRGRNAALFDLNGDGRLGPRERAVRRGMMFNRALRRFDRNRDGVLGPSEVPPRMARRLQRLDANGDGWVTRQEILMPRGPAARRGQVPPY